MQEPRKLTERDAENIRAWPRYTADMEQMDYALRQGGWLDETAAESVAYVFDDAGEPAAFTILAATAPGEAEFRIALRADRTGCGLGGEIILRTLELGFHRHGFRRIHLIVRKNNVRGIRLYRRIGFADAGECIKPIRGELVDFHVMEISREEFERRHGITQKEENEW